MFDFNVGLYINRLTFDMSLTDAKNIPPSMTPALQAAVVKDLKRHVAVIWPMIKHIDDLFPNSTNPTPEENSDARSTKIAQLQRRAKLKNALERPSSKLSTRRGPASGRSSLKQNSVSDCSAVLSRREGVHTSTNTGSIRPAKGKASEKRGWVRATKRCFFLKNVQVASDSPRLLPERDR